MAESIATTLSRIKHDTSRALVPSMIEAVCQEVGHVNWRKRELDPATTIALFLQQVLAGNCPCSEVRHLPAARGKQFTATAYCDARARVPRAVYQALLTKVIDASLPAATQARDHKWLGKHRVFHIDGSTFSMPDTPQLRKAFGTPKGQVQGCGFPVAHLLVLFSAATGLLLDAWASRLYTGDVTQSPEAVMHLSPGDVMVGDDSFSTYVHLALRLQQKSHGLFPVHHARIVDFTPARAHTRDADDGDDAAEPDRLSRRRAGEVAIAALGR